MPSMCDSDPYEPIEGLPSVSDQSLSVFPHFFHTTKYGTVPHMVDFNFIWEGGDFKEKLLPTKWYLISPDLEMQRANYEKHPNLESLLKVMDLTKVDPSIYIDDRDITGREFEAIVKALKDLGIQRIYRTNCFQSTQV